MYAYLKKHKKIGLLLVLVCLFFLPIVLIDDFVDKVTYKIYRTVFDHSKILRPVEVIDDAFIVDKPKGRIYDCCLFFNEIDILLTRLNELYDHVDHFVIVESKETHRGFPKPLNFKENEHLFQKFRDKIIYVPLDPIVGTHSPFSWKRENYQRNQILKGLEDCHDDDIIMISDLDEIPRGNDIPKLCHRLMQCKVPLIYCAHKTYRYFFNRWDVATTPWAGTAITTYKFLKKHSPQYTRRRKDRAQFPLVESGWHFTTMGGFQKVIDKYKSVVLHKGDTEEHLHNLDRIRREATGQFLVQIDKSFPVFVQNNIEYFKKHGLIDDSTDISLNQLWPNNPPIESYPMQEPFLSAKLLIQDISGWFDPSILKFIQEFIKNNSVQTVVEIKPWLGLSTQCFARLLPSNGTIYSIDTWSPEETPPNDPRSKLAYEYFLSNLIQTKMAHKVNPLKMDSIEAAKKLDICPQLIFIGKFRSPEHIYQDIVSWFDKMKPNGVICGMHGDDPAIIDVIYRAANKLKKTAKIEKSFWYVQ